MSVYVTDEPFDLDQAGQQYLLYSPRAAGIDFYGDNLFTTAALLKEKPDLVKKFRDASLKGWDYAMQHPEEMVQLMYARYSQRHSLEHLRFEARHMAPLLQTPLVELGHMHAGRWQHIAETYAALGMLPPDFNLAGFLYDPNPPPPQRGWLYVVTGVTALVLACLTALAVYIQRINTRLHREAAEHTRAAQALRQSELQKNAILNGITTNIALVDRELKILWANNTAAASANQRAADMVGKACYAFWGDPAMPCADCPSLRALQTGQSQHKIMQTPDGRIWDESGEPIFDQAGKVVAVIEIAQDITARTQVEELARQKTALLKSIMESPQGVIMFALDGAYRYTEFTLSHQETMRRIWGAEIAVGINMLEVISDPADRAKAQGNFDRALQGERLLLVEDYGDSTRQRTYYENRYSPIFDARGAVAGVTVFVIDITTRMQAEAALRASEERLAFALEGARDGIWDVDLRTNSVYLSPRGCELLGYAPGAYAASVEHWHALVHPDDLPATQAALDQYLGGRAPMFQVEQRLRTHCGDYLWILARGKISGRDTAGNPVRMTGTHTDITARKRAEEELRASEERYRSILNASPDAIFITDMQNGRHLMVSPGALAMFGCAHENELVGHLLTDFIVPDDRARAAANVARVLHGDGPGPIAFRGVRVDGSIFDFEVNGEVIHDATGQPIQMIAIARDITERKRAQEELLKMQKLQSVGTLAGGIAHDFNNILMGLFGNISLAKDEFPKGHPGGALLAEAEQSMHRAVRLTKQLLTFAKGGAPVKEDVSLGSLVEDVARFDLSGSNVMLRQTPAPDLWPAEVDKGQIQQVVSNLVINARQAMPKGGMLHITLENVTLPEHALPGLRQGRYVKVCVQDEGDGIDPKNIDLIFDPYFTTKQTGSGLGLATVYSVIHKHGGHIGVVSEMGKGTTFTFYLPAAAPAPAAETAPAAAPRLAMTRAARILVMDDEDVVRAIVARMLQSCGFTVATANGGTEALALYRQAQAAGTPFDAAIMDLTIPGGIGGKDAIKDILAMDPHAKVIVSSGYADDPVMANYADYGFKGVAAKPYSLHDLQEVLGQVLQ
ncbi:MAG: PAS domain S-box protein [bacterium]|nr:PAS domain S-box protein [bacterium]